MGITFVQFMLLRHSEAREGAQGGAELWWHAVCSTVLVPLLTVYVHERMQEYLHYLHAYLV